jgi:hypothetical protein
MKGEGMASGPNDKAMRSSESVLKISDRDPNGFACKQKSISGSLSPQIVNPLRQKNL